MRVFVAVDVNPPVRDAVARMQDSMRIRARPVKPESLHFTLRFLGEISEQAARGAAGALAGVAFSRFKVDVRGMGAFPNSARPRVVWVGAHDGGRLAELAASVDAAVGRFASGPAAEFKPHLTVFRVKNGAGRIARELEAFAGHEFGSMEITRVKLKSSVLGPRGPAYSEIAAVDAS